MADPKLEQLRRLARELAHRELEASRAVQDLGAALIADLRAHRAAPPYALAAMDFEIVEALAEAAVHRAAVGRFMEVHSELLIAAAIPLTGPIFLARLSEATRAGQAACRTRVE